MVHENSIKSYNERKNEGKIDSWRRLVFDVYRVHAYKSFTDREVYEALSANDWNLVRPEVTRLIKDGLLVQVGKCVCNWTGKTIRHCTWTGKEYFAKGVRKAVA